MKLVRSLLVAMALASLPALAIAQSNTAGTASGAAAGGFLAGPAGAFAGGVIGGAAADLAGAPLYEGRSIYVPPYPSSLAPGYVAPGPLYAMPGDGPLQRRCWTNVYSERQCETFR
jgi:hypothetical protein